MFIKTGFQKSYTRLSFTTKLYIICLFKLVCVLHSLTIFLFLSCKYEKQQKSNHKVCTRRKKIVCLSIQLFSDVDAVVTCLSKHMKHINTKFFVVCYYFSPLSTFIQLAVRSFQSLNHSNLCFVMIVKLKVYTMEYVCHPFICNT